jgi:hypothetical protein
LSIIDNDYEFSAIDHQVLVKQTVAEHQVASSIAKTIDRNSLNEPIDPLIRLKLEQKSKWFPTLIVQYKHEKHLEPYKQNIHRIWNATFTNTSVTETQITRR